MRTTLLPISLVGLAALAPAQNSFVVPSKAQNNQPGAVWYDSAPQSYPLWGTTSTSTFGRVQYLYDVGDIGLGGGLLQGMDVRPPTGYTMAAATYQTTIVVSMGPNGPTQASSVFGNNHGANPVTVFSGALNMPADPNAPWPRTWQPIPFSQPVPYIPAAGPSLVVEFQTSSSSTGRGWTLEGIRAELGRATTEHYQSNCRNSGGTASGGWSWQPTGLVPGGAFYVSLSGYPTNTPSLAANALFFGTSGLGSPFGPFTTPFPLANLGLPAVAGCDWSIEIAGGVGYTMNYRQYSTSAALELPSGTVNFPSNPALAGLNLYTQAIALDTNATSGMMELFPSIAIEWLIGTGNTVPCTRVSGIGSSLPTSGSVGRSEAAVLQFRY
jgi:hypothetical protein